MYLTLGTSEKPLTNKFKHSQSKLRIQLSTKHSEVNGTDERNIWFKDDDEDDEDDEDGASEDDSKSTDEDGEMENDVEEQKYDIELDKSDDIEGTRPKKHKSASAKVAPSQQTESYKRQSTHTGMVSDLPSQGKLM